jgi:epoxide hydrolase 4
MSRPRLHCTSAGPEDGHPVILLHGFPESSYAWRRQLPALAAAGLRVIAPDLRGCGLSPKPPRVSDYRIEPLVADVMRLAEGHDSVSIVGHDWGGIVAWYAAMWHPQRIRRLIILNAPHPAAYQRELFRSRQLLRSWYAFLFQLPWLPEAALRWDDFAIPRRFFANGPAKSEAEVDEYVRALARPGVLTGAINYYRAALRHRPPVSRIDVPTLLLWGDRDRYLVRSLTSGRDEWVSDLRLEHVPEATHWIHHDVPELVSQRIIEFVREPDAAGIV